MRTGWLKFGGATLLALVIAGCGGSDGEQGPPGPAGKDVDPAVVTDLTDKVNAASDAVKALTQAANPETCVMCHTGDDSLARTGPDHQAIYKQFYQDGIVKVSNMAFSVSGTTATLTFKMTKNSLPFDCTKPTSGTGSEFAIGSYWATYDGASKTFTAYQSMVGTKAWNAGTNVCTITRTGLSAEIAAQMAGSGIVQVYGVDEIVERITDNGKRLYEGKYPFAGALKVGTVDYTSAANVSGCENCHTKPFLKHAYIYGQVDDGTGTKALDFYTCKGCHVDTRNGGHVDWQILKDDPERYAEIQAGSAITAEEQTKYAYKAKLMNDVHMSHAMEFAYPQSMRNCVTCHAGKLDRALADSQFKAETCKSCHAVDGLIELMTSAPYAHGPYVGSLDTTDCTICHKAGMGPPTFNTIHLGGYDPKIYSTTGVRYADTFKVTVDSATLASNKLTIKFSATGAVGSLSAANIVPTTLVGLYGYDSKDFVVAAHGTAADGKYNLEYMWDCVDLASCGGSSRTLSRNFPTTRFTQVGKTTASGTTTWELTADLSLWAAKIADGSIKRAEIAVMPDLKDASGTTLGLNAPSRTFDLTKNAFDDAYFKDIVKVSDGCNTCHDQLATTFHSGTRGGNIKVCRICHETSNGGSNLELQSRSIDSYVHAVHSFQAFNPGDINFADPVESLEYKHHINSIFPRFGILNCESCHKAGMYDVPSQAKSMPGVLSGTDAVAGRNIGSLPPSVTGPAVRACGGCHRAQVINGDDANGLAVLTQHFRSFGYVIDTTAAESRALWESVVAKIMGIFK